VLADVETRAVDGIYHLGDLVGYAPWPTEVVAELQHRGIAGVCGNYDSTVALDYKHCGCVYEDPRQEELSHLSFSWTKAITAVEAKRQLGRLPFRLDLRPRGGHAGGPTLALVHATPTTNTLYWTSDRSDDFCRKMIGHAGLSSGDILAFGHTHLPWQRVVDGVQLINTGTVGRPKDGDPRAGYTMLEISQTSVSIEYLRVEYDVERTARAIEGSGLPREFAQYLRSGGRSLD
jgi:predicted phosphodiesterase